MSVAGGLMSCNSWVMVESLAWLRPTMYIFGRFECRVYSVSVCPAIPLVAPMNRETCPGAVDLKVELDARTDLRFTMAGPGCFAEFDPDIEE